MLFHEIYGTYYRVTAAILGKAVSGTLTREEIIRITSEQAFGESILTIPEALTDGTWPLLNPKMETPLQHAPSMPLTELQAGWLKTILSDPRVKLFLDDKGAAAGSGREEALWDRLRDTEPLYAPEDIIYFDRSRDSDPFEDPKYAGNFRAVLKALRTKKALFIRYDGPNRQQTGNYYPLYLEYSQKDDKFRLHTAKTRAAAGRCSREHTFNMASIVDCRLLEPSGASRVKAHDTESSMHPSEFRLPGRRAAVLELTDRRNALERAMLHFSDLEKETTDLGEGRYRIKLHYYAEDEPEIMIRILSFGPVIRVRSPESFADRIRKRIRKQMELQRPVPRL